MPQIITGSVSEVRATMSGSDVFLGEVSPAPPAAASAPSAGEADEKGQHFFRFAWKMDAEGRFDIESEEIRTLLGTNQFEDQSWEAISVALGLDPEGRVTRAIASRETWSGLTVTWPFEDERIAIELSGLPVFDRERNFRGYRGFGICHDLARLEALEALASIRSRILASAPTLSQSSTFALEQGVTEDAWHLARPVAQPVLAEHGLARPAATLENDAARPSLTAEAETSALGGKTRPVEGEVRDVEPARAAITGLRAILDRTERELLEARSQAEKALQARADILARVNHDIRIPLNVIIGFSEVMLEERFGPIGNARYREYLRDIHAAGGELLSLINDLVDLSKIEAGTFELSFSPIALNELIQSCVTLMQPHANRERVIIRTSLAPKLPHVLADALTIRQIILHLLSNSIRLTGAGGQVIVSTAPGEEGAVAFRIRDTGPGMTQKEIASALEPFRELAASIKHAEGGNGLDLPLTKALVEANHASLHIESRPNSGTLVEVLFPAARVMSN
jgi:signal transduction histidine kinase